MAKKTTAKKAPTIVDEEKNLQATLELMHYDAKRFKDNSFQPSYNFNASQMRLSLDPIIKLVDKLTPEPGAEPTIPETLASQIKNLSSTCDTAIQGILKNETNQEAWNKDFSAVIKALDAEIKPIADVDDKAALKAQLVELKTALEKMHNDGLMQEIKKMNENFKRQNEMNNERALTLFAETEAKNKSNFHHNDWKNESTNDIISRAVAAGVSTGGDLHTGADGMYTKPDSRYNVFKSTDPKTGEASYTASYTDQHLGFFALAGRLTLEVGGILGKIVGTVSLVIPALEATSFLVAKLASVLSAGNLKLPYRTPFETFLSTGKPIIPIGPTTSGLVLAEIDVAARRGKEHSMTINSGSSVLSAGAFEKAVVMLDELCKRADYKPAAKVGEVGGIGNPQKAMDVQIGMQFQKVLAMMSPVDSQNISAETKRILKEFHQRQPESVGNFDVYKFKEIFMREARGFQTAMQAMKQSLGYSNADRSTATKGNDGTSVITPTPGEPTSTGSIITPTSPPPSPSAPPAEPGSPAAEGRLGAGQKPASALQRLPEMDKTASNPAEPIPESVIRPGKRS